VRVFGSVAIAAVVVASVSAQRPGEPPITTGTGVIVGRVVDNLGAPVGRARVSIHGASGAVSRVLIADEDGEFFLVQLPRGDYWFSASKQGYFGPERAFGGRVPPGRAVRLADGERRLDILVTLWKPAVVRGRVTDEHGAPLEGVTVSAASRSVMAGYARLTVTSGGTTTDDRGQYRLSSIPPGEGAICATWPVTVTLPADGPDQRPRRISYPTKCHPDAEPGGMPNTLEFLGGEELTDIDFRLAPLPSGVNVTGVVRNDSGLSNVQMLFEPALGGSGADVRAVGADPDGRFSIDGVRPGRYRLTAIAAPRPALPRPDESIPAQIHTPQGSTISLHMPRATAIKTPTTATPQEQSRWTGSAIVDVAGDDVSGVAIALARGASLSGRVEIVASPSPDDPAPRPPRWPFLLIRASGWFGPELRPELSSEGRFTIESIPPGRYVFMPAAETGGWQVVRVFAGARELFPLPFDVADGGLADVTVVLANRQAQLTGRVALPSQPAAVEVFVFPSDERLWVDYGPRSPRMRRSFVDEAGNFAVHLPAGEYFVVATSSRVPDAWQESVRLRWLARGADVVVIPTDGRVVRDIRVTELRRPYR
jgi:hypothetical protein